MSKELGERLRAVRGDLSQIDFATRLGADKNTVGRYERGERQPDSDYLVRIHSEFGISLDWLLTGQEGKQAVQPALPVSDAVDADFYGEVLDQVAAMYRVCKVDAPLSRIGAEAATIAADIAAMAGIDRESALYGALSQLRRRLMVSNDQSSKADQGKHRA